jgi:hypothetical protein
MANDRNDERRTDAGAAGSNDTDEAFQEELRRESSEGGGLLGDTKSNRNLSGSSTWETLPDDASAGSDADTDRDGSR